MFLSLLLLLESDSELDSDVYVDVDENMHG